MKPPAETKERIVDAARELFHERGFSAVGVADICDRAKAVKGSFYHFFASKEDLLGETVGRNWDQLHALLKHLEADRRPGRDCIESLFGCILAEARGTHRESGRILGCKLGTIACELGAATGAPQERMRAAFGAWRRSLVKLIKRGQADGSIDPGISPAAAAEGLLASIQGMSVLGRALHQPAMLKRIAGAAMQQIPEPG